MGTVIVIFLGPAGSGKSTLVAAYSKWLEEGGASVYTVSLDPAVDVLPYKPGFDVRSIIDAREIARKYGLGPNGALVKAMEVMAERVEELVSVLRSVDAEYVLIDTPGQMEVFLFRDISWKLTEKLVELSPETYALFVLDASVIRQPEDYALLSILSTAVQLRLGVMTAPVLNKADLAPDIEVTGDLFRDFGRVAKSLKTAHSLYAEMLRDILRTLLKYTKMVEVPRVSAVKGEGIEDLHRLVLEMGCSCGDLS